MSSFHRWQSGLTKYTTRASDLYSRVLALVRTDRVSGIDKAGQIALSLSYKSIVHAGTPLPSLQDVGFRVFSQADEDGILLFIFSVIGVTNKQLVEACVDTGIECNAANLLVNHNWTGLLFEGNASQLQKGREFYRTSRDTKLFPPKLVSAWIDAESIDALIQKERFSGEIDLLSLDIDGMDYWIWKQITCIDPRVVVVEYQDIWGHDRAVTVPYKRDFKAGSGEPEYHGASLAAFVKLAREKGYRLIGCNCYGFNAFFLRNGVADVLLPEVTAEKCLNRPRSLTRRAMHLERIAALPWQDV